MKDAAYKNKRHTHCGVPFAQTKPTKNLLFCLSYATTAAAFPRCLVYKRTVVFIRCLW